jgi:hypothetical protein
MMMAPKVMAHGCVDGKKQRIPSPLILPVLLLGLAVLHFRVVSQECGPAMVGLVSDHDKSSR